MEQSNRKITLNTQVPVARMNCPRCKTEIGEGSEICCNCNRVIVRHGVSRLAVASFVLGVLSLTFAIFTAVPAIVLAVLARKRIRAGNGLIRGKLLVGWGIGLSCVGLFFLLLIGLWCIDASPIENDYTVADLRSADPEFNKSYEVLELLRDKQLASEAFLETPLEEVKETAAEPETMEEDESAGYGRGGPTNDYGNYGEYSLYNASDEDEVYTYGDLLKNYSDKEICSIGNETFGKELERYAEQIDVLWDDTADIREIIKRLDGYEQIADLTNISVKAQGHPFFSGFNMWHVWRLYTLHCCLETLRCSQSPEAELIVFDSVMRKCSMNARFYFTNRICLWAMQHNISAANFIVNDPNVSDETVARIREHFVPLSNEQLNLDNAIIGQYLRTKNVLEERRFDEYGMEELNLWNRTPLFKTNSTIRFFRRYIDSQLVQAGSDNEKCREGVSVMPKLYSAFVSSEVLIKNFANSSGLSKQYLTYNPMGYWFTQWHGGWMEGMDHISNSLQVRDDLFQIVLAMRLGEDYSLQARRYGENYVVDVENKIIYSDGPDGIAFTGDDIKLRINPEVLGIE